MIWLIGACTVGVYFVSIIPAWRFFGSKLWAESENNRARFLAVERLWDTADRLYMNSFDGKLNEYKNVVKRLSEEHGIEYNYYSSLSRHNFGAMCSRSFAAWMGLAMASVWPAILLGKKAWKTGKWLGFEMTKPTKSERKRRELENLRKRLPELEKELGVGSYNDSE